MRYTPEHISGEVESDELEISISTKRSKTINKKPISDYNTSINCYLTRWRNIFKTKRLTTEEITKDFDGRHSEGTTLITDAHPSYKSFAKENPLIIDKTFIAKDDVSKTDKKIHAQTENHTHRKLKVFLRQFNGVSSKYLQNYLNLFAYVHKLRESKHTIKQSLVGALLAYNAYKI